MRENRSTSPFTWHSPGFAPHLIDEHAPVFLGTSETRSRQLLSELRLRREAGFDVANLAVDSLVELIVRHFDLELLCLLEQELLVNHRVERLQLVRPETGGIGGRPDAALLVLQNPLIEVEARDHLIADDGNDAIERRVLRPHWLLSCQRRRKGNEREE